MIHVGERGGNPPLVIFHTQKYGNFFGVSEAAGLDWGIWKENDDQDADNLFNYFSVVH